MWRRDRSQDQGQMLILKVALKTHQEEYKFDDDDAVFQQHWCEMSAQDSNHPRSI